MSQTTSQKIAELASHPSIDDCSIEGMALRSAYWAAVREAEDASRASAHRDYLRTLTERVYITE